MSRKTIRDRDVKNKLLFTLSRNGKRLIEANIGVDEREVRGPGSRRVDDLRLTGEIVGSERKNLGSEGNRRRGKIRDIKDLSDGFAGFDSNLND